MNEFERIANFFAPLAQHQGALGLTDDAALVDVPAGKQLVITKDAIVSGVHFLGNESPELIARKLLRVNLSDLAAMGAVPYGYLVALIAPPETPPEWFAQFAQGLETDQRVFGCTLLGGDTTAGPLACSLTALGLVPQGRALKRSGSKPGDLIAISGTVGDAALGLLSLHEKLPSISTADRTFLTQRYQLPEPRLALGRALQDTARSCIDVSDGLVQDLGHLCRPAGLGATIQSAQLPLSHAAQAALEHSPSALQTLLTGGDDYELLFSFPAAQSKAIEQLALASGTQITVIGRMDDEPGVRIIDKSGQPLTLTQQGFQHFR